MSKQDEFIAKAVAIHGDKYEYTKVIYAGSSKAVDINCPKHGLFQKSPSNHTHATKPQGCPTCAKDDKRKAFISELIKIFKAVHGEKYDYSELKFNTSKKPVNITCPKHGAFQMRIDAHRNGAGCQKCAATTSHATSWEGYLTEFKKVHGDTYDYSKTVYTGYKNRISIRCPEHGTFKLQIASHRNGAGCPTCRGCIGIERGDTERFIQLATAKHGDKYDYSKSELTVATNRVIVICPSHGEFTPKAHLHIKGSGCAECVYESRHGKYSTEEIINRLKGIHGDKYDFSQVVTKNGTRDKVTVTCPTHGEFISRIDSLMAGSGCSKCGREVYGDRIRLTQDEVITRFESIHNGFYSYEKTEYTASKDKIIVTCPVHGDFNIEASKHLKGSGCAMCSHQSKASDADSFIKAAMEVHGNLYDYSKIEYSTAHTPVRIICADHGEFSQTPNNHKRGQGCPFCGEFARHLVNKSPDAETVLYYLTLKYKDLIFYKVGITTNSVNERFKQLHLDGVKIIDRQEVTVPLSVALETEQYILAEFSEYKILMFNVLKIAGGGSECFSHDVLGVNDCELADWV